MKLFGKRTQDVAQRIVEAFRHPETLPQALAPMFIHRKDDTPCRKWSWHNQLIIALSGTSDARGIRQWNQVERKVTKGSQAIWILAPCLKKIKDDKENGEENKRQILYGFRSVPVFAVEDTEGTALPEQDDQYAQFVRELPLMEVAAAWNIKVDTYSHHANAPLGYYQRSSNGNHAILMGVENLSTWCHELVHAADHRVTGLKGERWHKEIVAELGGAVLLECLGMTHDADLGGAYAYIASYAAEAKKDTVRACIEVIDRVCNCVKLILDTAESTAAANEPVELPAIS